MKADTALAWAAAAGMLHTVALEHTDGAIVHMYGNRYLQFSFRISDCDVFIFV
ncbi:hypothetical protein SDC9_178930 [bioreactor metagenome]|uniref:Uncharacterized protein n=1 Tax=bioreactor metagenome TaxID=1076179 RepID=A0A645GYW8_9ZZZZ